MSQVSIDAEHREKVVRTARENGKSETQVVHEAIDAYVLGNGEDWLDTSYHARAARDGDPSITIDHVRQGLSSISGSVAEQIIRDRSERLDWLHAQTAES